MEKDRTKEILKAAVEDYIKTGRPITSEGLYEDHNFGIKPAMIRWELNDLSEAGYFYQNHPSGGRYPSDKAYRFFVEELVRDGLQARYADSEYRNSIMKFLKGEVDSFVEDVSDELRMLSVGYEARKNEMWTSGLYELLENLDLVDKEELVDVVKDFEMLPEKIKSGSWKEEEEWPKVFIGKNPFVRSKEVAVVANCLRVGNENFLFLAIGPKRMDYAKPLELFEILNKSVENN